MMIPHVVPPYAAVLALAYIALAVSVIRLRRRLRVALGTGPATGPGDPLPRAIRVHANFAEYVPFALLLLTLAELRGTPPMLLHPLCAALVLGRLAHAYGVSRPEEDFRFRVTGMAATFATIGVTALLLLVPRPGAASAVTPGRSPAPPPGRTGRSAAAG